MVEGLGFGFSAPQHPPEIPKITEMGKARYGKDSGKERPMEPQPGNRVYRLPGSEIIGSGMGPWARGTALVFSLQRRERGLLTTTISDAISSDLSLII